MQKTLSRYVAIFLLPMFCLLFACGQKGALYLTEKDSPANTQGIFSQPAEQPLNTHLIDLTALHIVGESTSFSPNRQSDWKALLSHQSGDTNLLRYIVFTGDLLDNQTPITALVGYVQNSHIQSKEQQTLAAGRYLRIQSTTLNRNKVPTLLVAVKKYLQANPTIKRTHRGDFMIQSPTKLDVYLAVEKN